MDICCLVKNSGKNYVYALGKKQFISIQEYNNSQKIQ